MAFGVFKYPTSCRYNRNSGPYFTPGKCPVLRDCFTLVISNVNLNKAYFSIETLDDGKVGRFGKQQIVEGRDMGMDRFGFIQVLITSRQARLTQRISIA